MPADIAFCHLADTIRLVCKCEPEVSKSKFKIKLQVQQKIGDPE